MSAILRSTVSRRFSYSYKRFINDCHDCAINEISIPDGESARLPPLWLTFASWTWHLVWVLRFSSLHENQHSKLQFDQELGGRLVECPLLNPTFINIIIIIIIIIISLLSLLLIRHAHLFPILQAYVSFWWYRLML